MWPTSLLESFGLSVALAALYVVILAVYRITWHPLAKFPGLGLAAMTGWYETYYDCFLLGKFSDNIGHMHELYGRRLAFPMNVGSNANDHRSHRPHKSMGSAH